MRPSAKECLAMRLDGVGKMAGLMDVGLRRGKRRVRVAGRDVLGQGVGVLQHTVWFSKLKKGMLVLFP
jgi:hypothetical protein